MIELVFNTFRVKVFNTLKEGYVFVESNNGGEHHVQSIGKGLLFLIMGLF